MRATLDLSGHLTLRRQLQLLALKPAQRRRLAATLGRKVRVYSRKRLRAQKDLNNRAWAVRSKPRSGKRKLLRGMSKRMRLHSDTRGAEVGYTANVTGKIAYAHQHGVPETWNAAKAHKLRGKPDYEAPATRRQARALKREGYVVRRKGGKKKKPTMRWITEHVTLGQAGLVLKQMREGGQSKTSWVIPLPERSFLGADGREIEALTNTIFDEALQRIQRV
ncbi:phage virion morphogenesis protein [Microbulbifer sp. 2304DJ12-6]|uniref:phage virion morphogenesis protein n=1 Tax=Microbulbifer sp. 2304DJ12-6 TaxID=3233340 RepID=UPI0039AFA478